MTNEEAIRLVKNASQALKKAGEAQRRAGEALQSLGSKLGDGMTVAQSFDAGLVTASEIERVRVLGTQAAVLAGEAAEAEALATAALRDTKLLE